MRKILIQPLIYLLCFFILAMHLMIVFSCVSVQEKYIQEDIHIIHNIPFYPQKKYQCGPSSLASVLNFWGIKVTPEQIEEDIFSKNVSGTLTIDMVLYAERKGLEAMQYKGTLDILKKHLDSYWPLIVLVDYGIYPVQINHFLVVVGYNDDGFIVNSDDKREQFVSKGDFMKIWEKTDYWTLLIRKKTYNGQS